MQSKAQLTCLAPRPVQKTIGKFAYSQRARLAAAVVKLACYWETVVVALGDNSALAGRNSRHIRAPFLGLAASTLSRHKAGWVRWASFCADMGIEPGGCTPVQLADFCALLCPEDPEDAAEGGCSGAATVRSCLAALGFIASKAKVQLLTTALSDPSVEGYKRASVSQAERKEAAPLSLAAVSALESVFLLGNVPLGFRLLAGFLLACIWGSLRFADAACTAPSSLSVEGWVLRGSAWRTKVSKRGTPFGVVGVGLHGEYPGWGWIHSWMLALNEWLAGVPAHCRDGIDFLLPHFSPDGESVSSSPCSYAVAVLRLRQMLSRLQVKDSEAYTAHSAKATVISWGRQLDLDDTDLAKQGHHKVALGHCAGLYGRDDVFKALKVQASVLTALRQGWVPMRAQRRGAAQPLDEPPLQHKLRPLHEREFEAGFRSHFKPQLPGAALGIQTSVVDIASHRDLKKSLGFANLLQERSRSKSASRYVKEYQIAIL
jgi:hypothetical protein